MNHMSLYQYFKLNGLNARAPAFYLHLVRKPRYNSKKNNNRITQIHGNSYINKSKIKKIFFS